MAIGRAPSTMASVANLRGRVRVRIVDGVMRREGVVLTEAEVHRSFNKLFKTEGRNPESFEKAKQLLEQLRAETPLGHRLSVELEELRKLCPTK